MNLDGDMTTNVKMLLTWVLAPKKKGLKNRIISFKQTQSCFFLVMNNEKKKN